MRCSNFHIQGDLMKLPLLHGQLSEQLGQWIVPQDQRHLTGFSEIVAAILQSGSARLSHWLPILSPSGLSSP